jgi:hypothetical protein
LGCVVAHAAPKDDERQQKALELLRNEMVVTNKSSARIASTPVRAKGMTNAAEVPVLISAKEPLSHAEMEKLFLNGKISQKQYEQYLRSYPVDPKKKPSAPIAKTDPASPEPLVPKAAPNPALAAPPQPAIEDTKKADDVEAQIEAIIQKKKARDEALKNAPPDPEPKTKREKLNAVLKLYVNEKITEEEYNKRRDKIMAEPEE